MMIFTNLLQESLLALLRSRRDCVVGEVKQLEDGDLLQELLNAEKIDEDAQRHGVSGWVLDELLQLRGFDLGEEGGQLLEHLTEEGDDEVLRQLGRSASGRSGPAGGPDPAGAVSPTAREAVD